MGYGRGSVADGLEGTGEKKGKRERVASNEMCTFLILNISSLLIWVNITLTLFNERSTTEFNFQFMVDNMINPVFISKIAGLTLTMIEATYYPKDWSAKREEAINKCINKSITQKIIIVTYRMTFKYWGERRYGNIFKSGK